MSCMAAPRSEEHTSELQSPCNLVCRLLLEKKNLAEADKNFLASAHVIMTQRAALTGHGRANCARAGRFLIPIGRTSGSFATEKEYRKTKQADDHYCHGDQQSNPADYYPTYGPRVGPDIWVRETK